MMWRCAGESPRCWTWCDAPPLARSLFVRPRAAGGRHRSALLEGSRGRAGANVDEARGGQQRFAQHHAGRRGGRPANVRHAGHDFTVATQQAVGKLETVRPLADTCAGATQHKRPAAVQRLAASADDPMSREDHPEGSIAGAAVVRPAIARTSSTAHQTRTHVSLRNCISSRTPMTFNRRIV